MNLETSMLLATSFRMPGAIAIFRHASHCVVFYLKKTEENSLLSCTLLCAKNERKWTA